MGYYRYPPRLFHPGRHDRHAPQRVADADRVRQLSNPEGGPEEWKAIGDDLFEEVPPIAKRYAGMRLVHFDIDARNSERLSPIFLYYETRLNVKIIKSSSVA